MLDKGMTTKYPSVKCRKKEESDGTLAMRAWTASYYLKDESRVTRNHVIKEATRVCVGIELGAKQVRNSSQSRA